MNSITITKPEVFRSRRDQIENAEEITVVCKTHPSTNGKRKIWCTLFPDVYKFYTTPIPISVLQELLYDIKCAFLDKDIILRSDVRIIIRIEND